MNLQQTTSANMQTAKAEAGLIDWAARLAGRLVPVAERTTGSRVYLVSTARADRFAAQLAAVAQRGGLTVAQKTKLGSLMGRTEQMRLGRLRLGPGTYDGVRGIDDVYAHISNLADVAVLESKYRAGWTAARAMRSALGRGYGAEQMSLRWMQAVQTRMSQRTRTNAAAMAQALGQGRLTKYINIVNARCQSFVGVHP